MACPTPDATKSPHPTSVISRGKDFLILLNIYNVKYFCYILQISVTINSRNLHLLHNP